MKSGHNSRVDRYPVTISEAAAIQMTRIALGVSSLSAKRPAAGPAAKRIAVPAPSSNAISPADRPRLSRRLGRYGTECQRPRREYCTVGGSEYAACRRRSQDLSLPATPAGRKKGEGAAP